MEVSLLEFPSSKWGLDRAIAIQNQLPIPEDAQACGNKERSLTAQFTKLEVRDLHRKASSGSGLSHLMEHIGQVAEIPDLHQEGTDPELPSHGNPQKTNRVWNLGSIVRREPGVDRSVTGITKTHAKATEGAVVPMDGALKDHHDEHHPPRMADSETRRFFSIDRWHES